MEDPIPLLQALVRTESVNPDLVPGACGEAAMADLCARWLAARGFEVRLLEERPGRPTVVGTLRGRGGGRALLLNGHTDTVTLAGYDGDPLDPRIADGRLHGRGSFDMKSGVAAMMAAAARAAGQGLRGDVIVACVADEEYASHGSEELVRHVTADAAIVTEPSDLGITVAHKGFVWFEAEVLGRAAHGSMPALGVDAIARAGHFLVALEALDRRLRAGAAHPRLGTGSVHASLIAGGQELSSYPASCRISLERRTVPGETPERVEAELRAILDGIAAEVPDFRFRLTRGLARPPFEVPEDADILRCVRRHAAAALGREPELRGEPFWTDCAILAGAGIPCLLIGASGDGAHAATEWVDVASVRALTDILHAVILDFCA